MEVASVLSGPNESNDAVSDWEPPIGRLFLRILYDTYRMRISFDYLESGAGERAPNYRTVAEISNWAGGPHGGNYHECMRQDEGRTPSGAVVVRRSAWKTDVQALKDLWRCDLETFAEWAARVSPRLDEESRDMLTVVAVA